MHRVSLVCAMLTLLSVCSYASIYPTNYGFEMSDTSYWTENPDDGYIGVVTEWNHYDANGDPDYSWAPPEGDYLAVLGTGLEDTPVQLSRTITLGPGETIEGLAAFCGEDYLPFDDVARVTISDPVTEHVLWYQDITAVGDWGYTGWQYWSFTSGENVPTDFVLTYEVWNVGDDILQSYGLFDAAPGLPAIALVGAAPIVGALVRRRRR